MAETFPQIIAGLVIPLVFIKLYSLNLAPLLMLLVTLTLCSVGVLLIRTTTQLGFRNYWEFAITGIGAILLGLSKFVWFSSVGATIPGISEQIPIIVSDTITLSEFGIALMVLAMVYLLFQMPRKMRAIKPKKANTGTINDFMKFTEWAKANNKNPRTTKEWVHWLHNIKEIKTRGAIK